MSENGERDTGTRATREGVPEEAESASEPDELLMLPSDMLPSDPPESNNDWDDVTPPRAVAAGRIATGPLPSFRLPEAEIHSEASGTMAVPRRPRNSTPISGAEPY